MGEKTLQLFSLQGGGGSGPALSIAEQTRWRAKGLSPFLSPPPAFHHVSPTTRHLMGIVYQCWISLLEKQLWDGGDKPPLENRDLEVKCQSAKKNVIYTKELRKSFSEANIYKFYVARELLL